jgi:hypothetical protein
MRGGWRGFAVLAISLVAPVGAEAATLEIDGGAIVYAEEASDPAGLELHVTHNGPPPGPFGEWTFGRYAAIFPTAPSAPCATVVPDFSDACPASGLVQPMTVNLGAQTNVASVRSDLNQAPIMQYVTDLTLDGGAGGDRLNATADGGPKRLFGGDGADAIGVFSPVASNGQFLPPAPGNYVLDGGPGDDSVQSGAGPGHLYGYLPDGTPSPIPGPYSPDAPIVRDDGLVNDPDGAAATVLGGEGNDVVSGGSAAQALEGGIGNDAIYANAGDDTLDGGPGNDLLVPELGADTVLAGDGNDTIDGMVLGVAFLVAGEKPSSGAFVSDSFSCGAGDDWVIADPSDRVSSDCEHVGTRGTCAKAAEACAGTVVLTTGASAGSARAGVVARAKKPTRLGKGRFKVKGGNLMNQVANLNARAVRLVAAKGTVKATAKITRTAKFKRRKAQTRVKKVKLTLVADPTAPG